MDEYTQYQILSETVIQMRKLTSYFLKKSINSEIFKNNQIH